MALVLFSELIPKRIEVKPVIRCKACIMLQALGVALHPKLDLLSPTIAIQGDFVGKMFEVNFVTVPTAVETKKQNHGATRHRGKHYWPDWERSRAVKELAAACLNIARHAVTQRADEEPRIQTFSNC